MNLSEHQAKIAELVTEIAARVPVATIATCSEGQPWSAPVYFAFSPDLRRGFFLSRTWRRHSRDLASNRKIAGALFLEPEDPFREPVRGVQWEGLARALEPDESLEPLGEVYRPRFPHAAAHTPAEDYRLFAVEIARLQLHDELNFPEHPQQIVDWL